MAILLPAAAYLAAALLVTWPLVLHPRSLLGALQGPGDPYLNLWILGWDLRTLSHAPSALLDGRIFDANIFHPAEGTLTYSDHLIGQAIVLWPLFAATGDLVLCYNVLLIASLVASALAMHLFAVRVAGARTGAYVAGLAWGVGPYHIAHLLHLQLQALYLLPLTFWFLHRLAGGRRRRDALGLGAMVGLQAIASVYYGVIGAVGLVAHAVALVVAAGLRPAGVLARRLLLSIVVASALAAPVLWPYWKVQLREGFGRNLFEASQHAADVRSYLQAPPPNLLYGRTGMLWDEGDRTSGAAAPARDGPEQQLFPGFLVSILAAFGFLRARRAGRWAVALPLVVTLVTGLVLSLGPEGRLPVYAWLHQAVFGFQAIRAPARFAVLVFFGLAGLAAIGATELGRVCQVWSIPRIARQALAWAMPGLVLLECLNGVLPYVPAPPRSTAVGAWLRDAPEPGAVLYLPLDLDLANTPFMVASLEHGRPIVNGYSGQRPSFFVPIVEALRQLPSEDALRMLYDLKVRFVVSPRDLRADAPADLAGALKERVHLGEDFIYEVVASPVLEAKLAAGGEEAPPPPGAAPFAIGEELVYRVIWTGLAAGTATVRVGPAPDAPGGFVFTLAADTADWVSRFFEARDRFETKASQGLLPLLHVQTLREGRRRVDRVVGFDHAQHLVRVGNGTDPAAALASAPALPLAAGARDPLAAFFYARTLQLEPGTTVRFPVNDVGRGLMVELRATEVVTVDGVNGRVPALRVEPRFVYRLERRAPVQVVLWLSRDARRVPIAAEVQAVFGTVRVELQEYKAAPGDGRR